MNDKIQIGHAALAEAINSIQLLAIYHGGTKTAKELATVLDAARIHLTGHWSREFPATDGAYWYKHFGGIGKPVIVEFSVVGNDATLGAEIIFLGDGMSATEKPWQMGGDFIDGEFWSERILLPG